MEICKHADQDKEARREKRSSAKLTRTQPEGRNDRSVDPTNQLGREGDWEEGRGVPLEREAWEKEGRRRKGEEGRIAERGAYTERKSVFQLKRAQREETKETRRGRGSKRASLVRLGKRAEIAHGEEAGGQGSPLQWGKAGKNKTSGNALNLAVLQQGGCSPAGLPALVHPRLEA